VVGNEAFGIVEEDRELLDSTIYIEMPGKAESLNVASAAAVVLFEALRQRQAAGAGAS
jgi:tRNA G18 (ribose-2'-O)-methylase SpoU